MSSFSLHFLSVHETQLVMDDVNISADTFVFMYVKGDKIADCDGMFVKHLPAIAAIFF